MEMQYNECKTCEAKNGHAGLLINNNCLNCYDTEKTGNMVLHSNLKRTEKEVERMNNKLLK